MIFIDSNVFMYAAGKAHRYKKPCIGFLEQIAKAPAANQHCINTEVLQEILHRYKSIGIPQIGFELFDLILNLGLLVHPIELSDLKLARKIMREYTGISTRDAVHLGMMLRRDIKTVVTYDRDFSSYQGIVSIAP